jgi:hypothetical protein
MITDCWRLRYLRSCDDLPLGFSGPKHKVEDIKSKARSATQRLRLPRRPPTRRSCHHCLTARSDATRRCAGSHPRADAGVAAPTLAPELVNLDDLDDLDEVLSQLRPVVPLDIDTLEVVAH